MERNQAPLTTIECGVTDGRLFFFYLSLLRVGSHERTSFFNLVSPRSFL